MKRHSLSRFVLFTATLALTVLLSQGQTNTIVVPRETEAAFGHSKEEPLFRTLFEQIYAAREFSDLPVDAVLITDIAFRIDEGESRFTNFTGFEVVLEMNVFQGSLVEIIERKSGRQEPIVTVFEQDRVNLPGEPANLSFDIRFRLQKPFLYDRRLGHLVLTIDGNGGVGMLDVETISAERGFSIYLWFQEHFFHGMLATEFSYIILPSIESIQRFPGTNTVQVVFSHSCAPGLLQLEASDNVNGPYLIVPNAEFIPLSNCSMRTTVPASPKSAERTFYRIRQNLP